MRMHFLTDDPFLRHMTRSKRFQFRIRTLLLIITLWAGFLSFVKVVGTTFIFTVLVATTAFAACSALMMLPCLVLCGFLSAHFTWQEQREAARRASAKRGSRNQDGAKQSIEASGEPW